jgi:hypothetical protein
MHGLDTTAASPHTEALASEALAVDAEHATRSSPLGEGMRILKHEIAMVH